MIKTACCRQINLIVIKTHDLINGRPSMLRPVGPSAASRSGTASVEPGTADIAWLNAAVEQPSVLALSSRRALRAKPYSQERLNLYAPRQPAPIGSSATKKFMIYYYNRAVKSSNSVIKNPN